MNKTKQFIKDHQKTIITIGGTILIVSVARAVIKSEILHKVNRAIAIEVLDDIVDSPDYDMWLMHGPNVDNGLIDKITNMVSECGKTINIEQFD